MTKADIARASRIEFEGRDGDCLLFSTKSWTRPGIVHHITADFASGTITCNCENGRINHRMIDILTGKGDPCKHLSCVWMICKKIMEQDASL